MPRHQHGTDGLANRSQAAQDGAGCMDVVAHPHPVLHEVAATRREARGSTQRPWQVYSHAGCRLGRLLAIERPPLGCWADLFQLVLRRRCSWRDRPSAFNGGLHDPRSGREGTQPGQQLPPGSAPVTRGAENGRGWCAGRHSGYRRRPVNDRQSLPQTLTKLSGDE